MKQFDWVVWGEKWAELAARWAEKGYTLPYIIVRVIAVPGARRFELQDFDGRRLTKDTTDCDEYARLSEEFFVLE